MTESCCCPPEAGNAVCDLPMQDVQRAGRTMNACPACDKIGKPVQGQTLKAMLSVSLREVRGTQYLFCRTHTCPVVYFSADGEQTITVEHVRERVYQKDPEASEVPVCYCFHHTVGDLRTAPPATRATIVEDINIGINAGQCACDLRNPQGSCCLGNVRSLIKQFEKPSIATT